MYGVCVCVRACVHVYTHVYGVCVCVHMSMVCDNDLAPVGTLSSKQADRGVLQ